MSYKPRSVLLPFLYTIIFLLSIWIVIDINDHGGQPSRLYHLWKVFNTRLARHRLLSQLCPRQVLRTSNDIVIKLARMVDKDVQESIITITSYAKDAYTLFSSKSWMEMLTDITRAISSGYQRIPYGDTAVIIGSTAGLMTLARFGFRRFKTATDVPSTYIQQGSKLRGHIVNVNDSDNLRFYHKRIFAWGRPNVERTKFKTETINVRLAGIDAPEMGHFGGIPQPYSKEAKEWLTRYTEGRDATIIVHRLDQYARAVASVYIRKWLLFKKNVSLAMVEAGYATVYTSAGAEYGGIKAKLEAAEVKAKIRKDGMWKQSSSEYLSPADYKKQLKAKLI